MSTSFSATLVNSTNLGPNLKVAVYTLQLPSSWTAAGVACDLSAEFDYVFGAVFGSSGAVTDHANKYSLFGTITTSGKGNGGIAAASVTLGAHRDAGTAAAFAAVPDTTDLSAVNDLTMVVFGC
jgi:NAD/NADP transhydrogenase beta subunit